MERYSADFEKQLDEFSVNINLSDLQFDAVSILNQMRSLDVDIDDISQSYLLSPLTQMCNQSDLSPNYSSFCKELRNWNRVLNGSDRLTAMLLNKVQNTLLYSKCDRNILLKPVEKKVKSLFSTCPFNLYLWPIGLICDPFLTVFCCIFEVPYFCFIQCPVNSITIGYISGIFIYVTGTLLHNSAYLPYILILATLIGFVMLVTIIVIAIYFSFILF